MAEQLLKYILFRIRERAQEAAQQSDAEPEDLFRQGRRLAYYEVLDMLRSNWMPMKSMSQGLAWKT